MSSVKRGLLVLALALGVAGVAYASRPKSELTAWLLANGTPSSPTRVSATAPTPGTLTLTAGAFVEVQCDVAVTIFVPGVADGGNGRLLQAGSVFRPLLPDNDATVSFLPVSGTAVCIGWTLQ